MIGTRSENFRPVGRSLRLSVVEGALHAIMVGASESYLGALAVELGHRDVSLALLGTFPLLVGSLSQLVSAHLTRMVSGRRRLVATGAALQALSHLAFLAIAIFDVRSLAPLLLAKTMFWVSGSVITPAWNAWMFGLTRDIARARYFARRSMMCHAALLISFLFGGYVLEHARDAKATLTGFAVLFAVAMSARLLSAFLLGVQHDPEPPFLSSESLVMRLRLAARSAQWRVPLFIGALMFGTHMSAPFFTPYMLRTLRLDFDAFAALTAVSILAKALTFPLWRRAAQRIGLGPALIASGIAVAAVPLLWSTMDAIPALAWIQALSGIAWAGFEFASLQLLLESSPESSRVEFFSIANSLSGVLQLSGALVGSYFLSLPIFDYRDVFVLSSAARAMALLLLLPLLPWLTIRRVLPALFLRIVSVRPGGGVARAPVLPPSPEPIERAIRSETTSIAPPPS